METIWTGSVGDLVNRVGWSDARETFVDAKTGAKIGINIGGLDGATEQDEPFYIEHGENLYDAYNRKEAIMILSNIRKGKRFPDMPDDSKPKSKRSSKAKSKSRKRGSPPSLRAVRL